MRCKWVRMTLFWVRYAEAKTRRAIVLFLHNKGAGTQKVCCAGVPADLEVRGTAQGTWSESALHVGAQGAVLEHLRGG